MLATKLRIIGVQGLRLSFPWGMVEDFVFGRMIGVGRRLCVILSCLLLLWLLTKKPWWQMCGSPREERGGGGGGGGGGGWNGLCGVVGWEGICPLPFLVLSMIGR